MRKMAHIYSHWGKGVYWDVVEILRDQQNYQFEKDESSLQLLSDLIGCKHDTRFISWYRDCIKIGLFEETEKHFFCPPLTKNMENWEIKKVNGSKGGRPKKTETKPKPKPNQNLNHNRNETIREEKRREDNTYSEKDFLSDWNTLRIKHLKKPSHLQSVGGGHEKQIFKDLLKDYRKEDFKNALIGLFKQKALPNGNTVMQSNPRHFLNHFESYLTAYHDKNEKLYGTYD